MVEIEFTPEINRLYDGLVKASKVRWNSHNNKKEQAKFLKSLYSSKVVNGEGLKYYIWKRFFNMISWTQYLELFNSKQVIHKRRMKHATRELFSPNKSKIRGGCIFTALAGIIASISAAAGSAAATVGTAAAAVSSAVAGSAVASSVVSGLAIGAAAAAGGVIVEKIVH